MSQSTWRYERKSLQKGKIWLHMVTSAYNPAFRRWRTRISRLQPATVWVQRQHGPWDYLNKSPSHIPPKVKCEVRCQPCPKPGGKSEKLTYKVIEKNPLVWTRQSNQKPEPWEDQGQVIRIQTPSRNQVAYNIRIQSPGRTKVKA